MFHMTYYLLACTMVLTTVMCVIGVDENFIFIWGIGHQCMERGPFGGACNGFNEHKDELICRKLACALPLDDHVYMVTNTGPVDDGTPCGHDKACVDGECVFANPSELEIIVDNGTMVDCL